MPKIIRFYEPGPAENQKVETFVAAPPAPDEVRIQVQAIGVNQSDLIYRRGHHPMQASLPSCNGAEAAGVIESVGAQVEHFAPGDPVVVVPHMDPPRGTYAEQINIVAARVMPASPFLSAQENAAFWASYLTAYGGLVETAKLQPGDFVVIPAASSSVGLAAIQIAQAIGAQPIALTRDTNKAERLRSMGVKHVLVSTRDDLASALRDCTGGLGARVIFDPVGGNGSQVLASVMAMRGIYVLYGVMAADVTPFPIAEAFENLLTMTVFRLDAINRPDELQRARAFFDKGLAEHLLKPVIDTVFAFDDVVAAHRYIESNRHFGKVVLAL